MREDRQFVQASGTNRCSQHRDIGFYWVKVFEDEDWTVAYFDGCDTGPWMLVGSDEAFEDSDFAAIGDHINRPKDD